MIFAGFEIVVISYLLGSIPFGFLVAKTRGIDIRQHGSGNIGATNVLRVLGKKWGIPVFVLDALKGLIAVRLAMVLGAHEIPLAAAGIMGAVCCILGHNFPIWLGFKGGKGIATSAGVLLGMLPVAGVLSFCVWLLLFFLTRYVSLASIFAAITVPVVVVLQLIFVWKGNGWPFFYFALVIAVLAVWRHRSNIKRLLTGTEPRFEKKKETESEIQDGTGAAPL
ncbi:MAG: acyl phosphate:glycerol-3-phosphate acyltransferase [Chthoniobacter sp.]|jgi:glycerol-3-phosphate acyltransferase PlsY|nr:acyl phosphate:glycerol-3-phosphate acyltransferase [Chthoniobacter sp.]